MWSLPEGDADFPTRWRLLKHRFSRAVGDVAAPSDSRVRQGERGVWQRRYWERCVRDEAEWRAAVRYCRENPVKHGFVARAEEWPYSTVHREAPWP